MSWLFDASSFITRNHCGNWTSTLIAINRIANLLIFIAYFTIPLSLYSFWTSTHKDAIIVKVFGQKPSIILCFVVFIFSCGLTHLCDVLAFDWAPYRLFTLVDVITAIASVFTAVILPGVIKTVLVERLWEVKDNERTS